MMAAHFDALLGIKELILQFEGSDLQLFSILLWKNLANSQQESL